MSTINKNLIMIGLFTAFENDPTRSWIRLQETRKEFKETVSGVALVKSLRSALVTVPTEDVEEIVKMWKIQGGIDGQIYVTEMLQGDLPLNFTHDVDGNVKDISKFEKFAGETGIPCSVDGEQIYRFAKYDPSGEKTDTLVAHDNNESIRRAVSAQRKEIEANKNFDNAVSEDVPETVPEVKSKKAPVAEPTF